jgi:hypothetical protein
MSIKRKAGPEISTPRSTRARKRPISFGKSREEVEVAPHTLPKTKGKEEGRWQEKVPRSYFPLEES